MEEKAQTPATSRTLNLGSGLIFIVVGTLVFGVIVVFFPSNPLRIVFGLPFAMFFPGYSLIAVLYTNNKGINAVSRFFFSIVISLAVVPILAYGLSSTTWGLTLEAIFYSIAAFIGINVVIGSFRRYFTDRDQRSNILIRIPNFQGYFRKSHIIIVTISVVLAAVGTLLTLTTFGFSSSEESFTEFYMLSEFNKAKYYPLSINAGDSLEFNIGIINHENETAEYHLKIYLDEEEVQGIGPILLTDDQKWEEQVNVEITHTGENMRLEFILFKGDQKEPLLKPLGLWLEVD